MCLDDRKSTILKAIVSDYIISAEPVGSRTLARKYNLGISAATIRNEMADLEDLGYLTQPHTSAGRIPSDRGYRIYVDGLKKIRGLSADEASFAKNLYNKKTGQIENIITNVANILSDLTNYTAIATAPNLSDVKINHIQLVSIDSHKALLVIITNSGIVRDTVVPIPSGLEPDFLNRCSHILNQFFTNKSLLEIDSDHIRDLEKAMEKERHFFGTLIDAINVNLVPQHNVYLGGMSNILNFPEYQDIFKAKTFLNLMERKDLLYRMLCEKESDLSVVIGKENEFDEMQDYSVISATYKIGDRIMGRIGLIGPTRMEYDKAIITLDSMGSSLTKYLTDLFKDLL